MIEVLGDWPSEAYKRYIDVSLNKRINIMKVFMDSIDNYLLTSFLKWSLIHLYNLEVYTNDAFSDEEEAEITQIIHSAYLQYFIKQQTR